MKKSIKSVLAKSLAVVMAFSLAGIAPNTSSEAAAKKPTLTKKVTVTVGKKKTVKVTSKKKVKKTTWSLNKKGKKVVSLSKKKAKSVVVKGKKAGKATLTAKIKVGKKTYKKTCKITVKKASKVNVTPVPAKTDAAKATSTPANNNNNNGGTTNATPTPTPTEAPVSVIKTEAGTYTVDESATYNVPLTELNETTFTCDAKRSDGETVKDGTLYNKDGSVTFTSTADYNSGVSYYINPATKDDDIIDISDTRGEGFMGYDNGTKDMSAYDYVRVKVTSENEMNCRTYNGNDQLRSAGFPGSSSSETYEGGWIHTDDEIWEAESTFTAGNTVKAAYKTRTIFIPISMLIGKGMNPETLTAIAFCPQSSGAEVTIHRIDFVKVKYDKLVTGIDVKTTKTEIAPGKTATVTATVTPADATRQIVKWTSSNEDVATVNFAGTVVAKKGAEGTTTIDNAAKEPHVVDVANFLNTMGADIRGAGTDIIKINGVKALHGNATYSVVPDQIEAGTFMLAAVASKGDITIKNCITKHLECVTAKLLEIGAHVEDIDGDTLRVWASKRPNKATIKTAPYPGFPTDLQPQMGVVLAIANGTSIINESIWDSRFQYTAELNKMGANITASGKSAVFQGVNELLAAPVYSTDLRAGAALIIAGTIAKGKTEVYNLEHIDRGYEHIEDKFRNLGAKIERVSE